MLFNLEYIEFISKTHSYDERYDFDGKSREISFQIRFIAFEVNYVDFCFIQFNHCHVFQSISFLNP